MSTFRIPVVFFEKSERFTFAGADYNLSLFTRFNRATFMVDQVYIILRIRQPHASRFRFHPRHSGDGEGCFCLSETFHQFDTRQLLESFKYGRVQCLSGNGAIFKWRQVVLCQVFVNQEPEDGRRRTERGDMVFLDFFQNSCRGKLLVVVDEDIGSGNPLSVEFSPYRFSPAGIGNGEVKTVLVQVVPKTTGNDMT